MKLNKSLEVTFLIGFVVIFLVALGVLPRVVIIPLTVLFAAFVLTFSLEESALLFARFIPFFVAIPITDAFDSFNMWRVISGLIFLKWYLLKKPKREFRSVFPLLLLALIFIAAITIPMTEDKFISMKRVIYFINLSLVPIVIAYLVRDKKLKIKPLLENMIIPGLIVAAFGFVQLISTYLVDIWSFHLFWGKQINLGLYGTEWSRITMGANTWFAYYGEQLSLRMFSTFPDSHSFPIFLLLTIPALYALKKRNIVIALLLLAAILSGTRGIWLAFLAPIILSLILFRKIKLWKHFVIFILLFVVAYPIFASPQFRTNNSDLLTRRLRSIIDFSETSNSGRIAIWKSTISSIIDKPLLGVGIGNYPVVLDQAIYSTRAGSSAHNLYLHIAAEMGVLALIIFLYAMFWLGRKIYWMTKYEDELTRRYALAALLYFTWFFAYLMTDVTLFDERVFLLFGIQTALIYGSDE